MFNELKPPPPKKKLLVLVLRDATSNVYSRAESSRFPGYEMSAYQVTFMFLTSRKK